METKPIMTSKNLEIQDFMLQKFIQKLEAIFLQKLFHLRSGIWTTRRILKLWFCNHALTWSCMALVHFHPMVLYLKLFFGGQRFFSKTSDEKLKNWRVSLKMAYFLSWFRRISFFSWFFLLES
jgi:hypothetical protein